jgi:hypothetical protein
VIRSDQYTIGTAASLLAASSPGVIAAPSGWFYITNGSGATIYLGAAGVTSSNGASVATSATLTGYLFPGDKLYACTASSTSAVGVLQSGT